MKTAKQTRVERNARGQVVEGNSLGLEHRWQPGQSGNPAGSPRARRAFEAALMDALMAEGSPEECARLLWQAAREDKAPWAIQTLLQRLAPQTQNFKLIHEREDHAVDYTKLTDAQLQQLESLLEAAGVQPPQIEGGEVSAEPQSVR